MDNQDLEEIQKEIDARKELQVVEEKPLVDFSNPTSTLPTIEENPKDVTRELIETAFNEAIIHKVKTDESVQQELLESADTVIHNKVNAIKDKADLEEKEAHFNNKKGACECFGYNEATTEKWAVNVMNFWHNIMTAIWLFIGFFTFAPVTFIAKKIVVIMKKSWIAVLFALIIYFSVVAIPLLVGLLK